MVIKTTTTNKLDFILLSMKFFTCFVKLYIQKDSLMASQKSLVILFICIVYYIRHEFGDLFVAERVSDKNQFISTLHLNENTYRCAHIDWIVSMSKLWNSFCIAFQSSRKWFFFKEICRVKISIGLECVFYLRSLTILEQNIRTSSFIMIISKIERPWFAMRIHPNTCEIWREKKSDTRDSLIFIIPKTSSIN